VQEGDTCGPREHFPLFPLQVILPSPLPGTLSLLLLLTIDIILGVLTELEPSQEAFLGSVMLGKFSSVVFSWGPALCGVTCLVPPVSCKLLVCLPLTAVCLAYS
jgi:hypothetical protein